MEKLHEYKRFGFSLAVYPNRITVVDKGGGVRGFAGPKETSIPVRSIASVAVQGLTRKLQIAMNDGTLRKIPVYGKDAERVRELVAGML